VAQIQMTEALSSALIVRFQSEYGQQSVSNFALDILLDSANAEIARLQLEGTRKDELIAALMEKARLSETMIETLKQAADAKRAEVMGAADRVRHRRAMKVNGSDPH
jgi:RecA/RadA recombinase